MSREIEEWGKMKATINFTINLNDEVKIKLKDQGIEILKQEHERINQLLKRKDKFELKLDEDGYYKEQLWKIMQVFGKYIAFGADVPFETDIIVFEKAL